MPPVAAQGDTPIRITSDANIAACACTTGAGTSANPYIIAGRTITPTGGQAGIDIANTRAYIIIQDVTVVGGGANSDGIRLSNTSNIVIQRADLQFNRAGIHLQDSNGTIVRDSTIRTSKTGIVFEGTAKANIQRNSLAVNDKDVSFQTFTRTATPRALLNASANVFRDNNLSIATGQFGFFFTGIAQYENDIDASNVVNSVPVRWFVRAAGTAAQPLTIDGHESFVKGTNNIGQIVCYACSHVRLTRMNASLGAASGLVLEGGSNIVVTSAFTEGNEGSGILALNASFVTIEGSASYANGVGVRAFNTTNLTITSQTAASNARGVHVDTGANATIQNSRVENNTGDGIVLEKTTRATVANNVASNNKVDGLRATGGRDHVVRDSTFQGNGGAGITLTENTLNVTVTSSRLAQNAKGGVVIGKGTLLSRVNLNTVVGNGEGGIWLSSAGPVNRVEANELGAQARHIRISATEQNTIAANNMTAASGETGFWFDDETSYLNEIPTSNLVGRTPVQWHVALVGTPQSPIVLRGIRAETANLTNIAQVMVYKGSYVRVEDTVASLGARGIFALKSSSIVVNDATLRNNTVGVEYRGTQSGEVRRVVAAGSQNAVLLADTLNVTVSEVSAPDVKIAVEFADSRSRGSLVERINATGTRDASVKDPSIATGAPRHLIADAGLDKLAPVHTNVTFSDATGVARFGSERIVRQSWDFGDGEDAQSANDTTLRPTHNYSMSGNLTATYRIETADGLALTDTVKVRIVPPPPAPTGLNGTRTDKKVALNWTPPESEFPIKSYHLFRGLDAENMSIVANFTNLNETNWTEPAVERRTQIFYAVTATAFGGDSELSAPFSIVLQPPPPPPEPEPTTTTPVEEPKGSPMPGPVLLAIALGAAALVVRRRRG